ncbi:hypothetical protein KL931_001993 [Ogataea haglerorum]|nr:hypothetical protein KL931_001993 [Ogataea haglerorum]
MDSSDNSNDCQGDKDDTGVSEPVAQMPTPEPAPLDVPQPSTPPAQGRVLCSAGSAGSSEITTLSLSSPPLTPPPRPQAAAVGPAQRTQRSAHRRRVQEAGQPAAAEAEKKRAAAGEAEQGHQKPQGLRGPQAARSVEHGAPHLLVGQQRRRPQPGNVRIARAGPVRPRLCRLVQNCGWALCVGESARSADLRRLRGRGRQDRRREHVQVHQQPRDRADDVVAVCGNRRVERAGGRLSPGPVFPVWLRNSGRERQTRAVQPHADVRGAAERDTAVFRPAGQGLPEPEAAPPGRQLLRVSCGGAAHRHVPCVEAVPAAGAAERVRV